MWISQLLMLGAVIAGLFVMFRARSVSDPVARIRRLLLGAALLVTPGIFFGLLWLGDGWFIGT